MGLSKRLSMNSSVALTTSGSGLGKGNPEIDGELASRMISIAGNLARDSMVYVSSDAAAAALEDESGGESAAGEVNFLGCGVVGSRGIAELEPLPWLSVSLSRTILASASFARRTSTLKRHNARSLFGRLINSSVSSPCLSDSSLLTAACIRSFSDVGGTEPEGEDVRGGVDSEPETEMGVDGCSGADAVALRALGPSNRES